VQADDDFFSPRASPKNRMGLSLKLDKYEKQKTLNMAKMTKEKEELERGQYS